MSSIQGYSSVVFEKKIAVLAAKDDSEWIIVSIKDEGQGARTEQRAQGTSDEDDDDDDDDSLYFKTMSIKATWACGVVYN